MKFFSLYLSLALSGLLISCSTIHPDHSAVSADWLDITPRKADYPPRQADGITHWNIGLPPVQAQRDSPQNHSGPALATRTTSSQADDASQNLHREPAAYVFHHQPLYRSRRYRSHYDPPRTQRQPFQRTVEKVGPSIVPRPAAPVIDRTLGASSSLNDGLSQRSRAHR